MNPLLDEIRKRAGIVGQQIQDPRQKALQMLQQAQTIPVNFLKKVEPVVQYGKDVASFAGIGETPEGLRRREIFTKNNPKPTDQQTMDMALNFSPMGVTKVAKTAPAFKGFDDITTKVLNMLKGKAETSKQEIQNFTNQPQLKQAERDLIRRKLEGQGDKVNVSKFAQSVKDELLPLERTPDEPMAFKQQYGSQNKYESIVLPDNLRGPIANYSEHIYNSPVKTSAGNVHFGQDEANYFAHTRVEDLPTSSGLYGQFGPKEPTRRIIELQSDLFQKGGLDKEIPSYVNPVDYLPTSIRDELQQVSKRMLDIEHAQNNAQYLDEFSALRKRRDAILKQAEPVQAKAIADKTSEISKLKPYENTWHERVIREEVKKAAQDGKAALQFPTGETAMKIEGLGENADNWVSMTGGGRLRADGLKVGQEVGKTGEQGAWIVTDVLGNGKFKAVPLSELQVVNETTTRIGVNAPYRTLGDMPKLEREKWIKERLEAFTEEFDISGKVDTENPIYKFYDKEVSRYLTNKYGAKRIKDPQGVEWMEVDIKPEQGRLPIEAFGMLPFINMDQNKKENKDVPIYMR